MSDMVWLLLALSPYALRTLWTCAESRARKRLKEERAGTGQHQELADRAGSIAAATEPLVGSGKVSLYALEYGRVGHGWEGWHRARNELHYDLCAARCISVARLLALHLIQPSVYCMVLWVYAPVLSPVLRTLGIAVAAREAILVLLILVALWRVPAFLLVNLDAEDEAKGRLFDKAKFVLCPISFLTLVLGRHFFDGCGCLLFALLDLCSIAALGVGAYNDYLPAPLAVSYIFTVLSLAVMPVAMYYDDC